MKKLIMFAMSVGLMGFSCLGQGKLLKRVKQQADVVGQAYGETWNTFYGDGCYKTLMIAMLDTRPDGTPNIVLDEKAGKMEVTIRLAVNEPNYNAWKDAAHKRFKDANMSYSFSDFEDTEGRMIGGKNYKFGENEEAAIRRWEAKGENKYKAMLTVRVRLLNEKGVAIRTSYIQLKEFSRLGFVTYPIPLHNLNRLMELPRSRFHWFDTEKEPKADSNVEDGYAKIAYSSLSKTEMDSLDEVKCDVLDEVDMLPIREAEAERLRKEREAEAERLRKLREAEAERLRKEREAEAERLRKLREAGPEERKKNILGNMPSLSKRLSEDEVIYMFQEVVKNNFYIDGQKKEQDNLLKLYNYIEKLKGELPPGQQDKYMKYSNINNKVYDAYYSQSE